MKIDACLKTISKNDGSQLIKYCCVGGVNTLLSLSIIFSLTWLGLNLFLANFIGYCAGVISSYYLNCKFTFAKKNSLERFLKFITVLCISYGANIICIVAFLQLYPSSKYLSQLAGMVVYTILGFILNKIWGMK